MQDLNIIIERIIALHDSGGNPAQMMQSMCQATPNVNQMAMQYKNMSQGKSPSEVLLQLAKQGGVTDKNIEGLSRILNGTK